MLIAITGGAGWATAADILVAWILGGLIIWDYYKEWKESQ